MSIHTQADTINPVSEEHEGHSHDHSGEMDSDGAHEHKHCCPSCCGGHEHEEQPQDLDLSSIGKSKENRSILRIMNMDCPMEEALIRKKLASVSGIEDLNFNLMQRVLIVEHDKGRLPDILTALDAIDMHAEEINEKSGKENIIPQTKIPWKKLTIAGLLALCSEIFELLGEWNESLAHIQIASFPLMEILAFLFAMAAIALGGLVTFRKGWLAISNLNLNINALMAVAVTGAVIIGQFPEAAMVMVLFNISEAIEAMALDKARNDIKKLLDLAPAMVTVLDSDGKWREAAVDSVPVGSIVRVRPGEKVGLDGIITAGHSEINQAPITGESIAVEKGPGDQVFGGTINESGSFEFRVTSASKDSTLARIIHTVEEAQASRAPMQRFVDIFAKYYTPCVFILALLWALLLPLLFDAGWYKSVYTALVLLVIGCPCALVISTPVTVVGGLAAATRKGILIKGGLYLEQGRHMNWLALDKTGTITYGQPKETGFVVLENWPEEKVYAIAASLASRSDHPVSRAIALAAKEKGIKVLEVENFSALAGKGVSGELEGEKWSLGNYRLVEFLGKNSGEIKKKITLLEEQGNTVVALVGKDGVAALFMVADTIRPSSVDAIQELKKLNVQTMMLTGDNQYTAQAIARQAGVNEFRANLLPGEKLEEIGLLEKGGNIVGMAGDGINDAPALAKANIGFSMAGGGSDTAIEVADVALMDDDLRKIPVFIRLSRATYTILVENISIALGIKAIFFALTLTGYSTMWMAVFADVGAALIVVANGLRIMRK